ncbi:hypothetical protein [Sphingomonas sp.]|uniref:hypothetical protein n=1 Tax=Sphingomonas sp. TaxID=28214 RepID=UPI003D6C7168
MNTPPPTVKRLSNTAKYDVIPQAIFWRSIQCFALNPQKNEDELDVFLVASFVIGNHVNFDLRRYDGHPQATVTVYIPSEIVDPDEIDEVLELVIAGLRVPPSGIAWKHGEAFEFGHLPRHIEDRLLEREARLLALKIAAEGKDFEATTDYIKNRVPELVPLTSKDLEPSRSRPREKLWQQIVGNVISHRGSSKSLFTEGLAERTSNGLRVTELGIAHLKSVGFIS